MPGADPTTMASSVALPLEKQCSTISDIDSMSSVNSNGTTQIKRHKTYKQLPNDLPTPPSYCKVNPTDTPIFYLSLTSETLPLIYRGLLRRNNYG
ncbi:hypothetical protein [Rickettsia parkeri]|uniref:hypothetical protein n=1 Tax=Rickettsia parkeri TaxID=35792 RepID=UPI0021BFBD47|nr:hypothetical protein [Rickettsia parkeri]